MHFTLHHKLKLGQHLSLQTFDSNSAKLYDSWVFEIRLSMNAKDSNIRFI